MHSGSFTVSQIRTKGSPVHVPSPQVAEQPRVTIVPTVQVRKPSRVTENVRASDGQPLSPELLETLKRHAWARNFYEND